MNLPLKVYIVDVYGGGSDIRTYKSRQACSYFNNKPNAKIYEGTVYDWEQIK